MYRGPTGLIVPSLAPVCHTFEEARESNEESAEPINIEFGPGFKVYVLKQLFLNFKNISDFMVSTDNLNTIDSFIIFNFTNSML